MTRQKPSEVLPQDNWIAFRDAPDIIERVYGIPASASAPLLRRAVEKFALSHDGFERMKGKPAQGNLDLVIPHKLSDWDAARKQWDFLPTSREKFRPPKGLERQAGDKEMRAWDWELAAADWQVGTVQGPMERRLDILLHWRNVKGWVDKMVQRGYLVAATPTPRQRPETAERRKPRPTPAALAAWFKRRAAEWPAGRKLPSEAEDWKDAQDHFKAGIDREEFRDARRSNTPPDWRVKGARPRKPKVWPFVRAD